MYDFLVVGAGLFGSVVAHELNKAGKKVLVIDQKNHIGGACYTENINGLDVHKYGAHIFNTKNKYIWDYVNQFSEFNNYRHKVYIKNKNEIFSLPFNMNTFYSLWGLTNPSDVEGKLNDVRVKIDHPRNLQEFALSLVGKEIYEKMIYGYTFKQWGKEPKDLPVSILKRISFRFNFDNDYFGNNYQGIPVNGYTKIFEKLLDGIEVKLNSGYVNDFSKFAKIVIYTGRVDDLLNYKFGILEYRSLIFSEKNIVDYQGNSVINWNGIEIPYTRSIQHSYFYDKNVVRGNDIVTYEKSIACGWNDNPFYPINDERNQIIYNQYLNALPKNIIVGGRIGGYRYLNMDEAVEQALLLAKKLS